MRKVQDDVISRILKIKKELKLSYEDKLNDRQRLTFFLLLREELEEMMDKIEKRMPKKCSCGKVGCKGKVKRISIKDRLNNIKK